MTAQIAAKPSGVSNPDTDTHDAPFAPHGSTEGADGGNGTRIHPLLAAALNAQHYEWYPEELNHPNAALRLDAQIRLRETSHVVAEVLRWAALHVPDWSRPAFFEHELDVSAAIEELADDIEAADNTKEQRDA